MAKKFLTAIPGPGGGYRLNDHPKDVSLYDIIVAVDGDKMFDRCIMGLSKCSDDKPCPIHTMWKKLKESMLEEMKSKDLEELMKAVEKKR